MIGFSTSADERAVQQRIDATNAGNIAWILLAVCAFISVVFTVIVVIAIRKSILTPINEIVTVYTEISKGNKKINVTYESKDELGRMAALIRATNERESISLAWVS